MRPNHDWLGLTCERLCNSNAYKNNLSFLGSTNYFNVFSLHSQKTRAV